MKTQITLATAFLLFAAHANANSYLDFGPADQSNFINDNGQPAQMKITQYGNPGWKKYSGFLGQQVWLYSSALDEKLFVYDEAQRVAQQLVDFSDPVGKRYSFNLGPCNTGGSIVAKGLSMNTLAGNFSNVVHLRLDSKCADDGITEAWFAPKVGVIKWGKQSIAGVTTWNIGSATVNARMYGFATLESALRASAEFPQDHFVFHSIPPQVESVLVLNNVSNQDMQLTFHSGQEVEVTLYDANHNVINLWSANIRFVQAFHDVNLRAGDSHRFAASIALRDMNSGQAIQGGQYFLKIELANPQARFAGNTQNFALSAEIPIWVARSK